MSIRANKVLEEIVIEGLDISQRGDYFGALIYMKNNDVPNNIIARVLLQQSRGSDKLFKHQDPQN